VASFCTDGLSAPKSGVQGQVTATAEAVALILGLRGLVVPAAIASAIAIGINFAAPAFCAADPPVDPQPTQTDLFNALQFSNPSVSLPALFKYQQWFLSHYWYEICACTNGTTPQPPPLSPPGSSTSSPGLPAGRNEPCWDNAFTVDRAATTVAQLIDATPQLLPTAGPSILINGVVVGSGSFNNVPVWPIPTTASQFHASATGIGVDGTLTQFQQMASSFVTYNSATTAVNSALFGQADNLGARSFTMVRGDGSVWPPGSTHWSVSTGVPGVTSPSSTHQQLAYQISGVCSGPALEPGCCPPDPNIDAQLKMIIQYLQYLINQQQPRTSTRWNDGTRHTGLINSGRLVLQAGVTAVRVEVTTVPPTVSTIPGNPQFFWDLGFVTPIAADIPLRGQRIVFNPENFSLPIQADGISWTLAAGAVIDLVELVPG